MDDSFLDYGLRWLRSRMPFYTSNLDGQRSDVQTLYSCIESAAVRRIGREVAPVKTADYDIHFDRLALLVKLTKKRPLDYIQLCTVMELTRQLTVPHLPGEWGAEAWRVLTKLGTWSRSDSEYDRWVKISWDVATLLHDIAPVTLGQDASKFKEWVQGLQQPPTDATHNVSGCLRMIGCYASMYDAEKAPDIGDAAAKDELIRTRKHKFRQQAASKAVSSFSLAARKFMATWAVTKAELRRRRFPTLRESHRPSPQASDV